VGGFGDDKRNSLVKISEARRKTSLAESADTWNKRIVEGREDSSLGVALFLDPLELVVLARDPRVKKISKEASYPLSRWPIRHPTWLRVH